MTIKKTASLVAASGIIALSLSGLAYADDVTLSNTGPGSTNNATVTNNDTVNETNNNNVAVNNQNNQTATSGAANANVNTNGGSASTGSASNNNSTTTAISIGNNGAAVLGVGGAGATGGTGGGGASGSGAGGASATTSGAGGAGGVSVLPKTGPDGIVDVAALRNAVQSIIAPTPEQIKKTSNLSTGLLAVAALLSLIGAVGSALYASKREKKLA